MKPDKGVQRRERAKALVIEIIYCYHVDLNSVFNLKFLLRFFVGTEANEKKTLKSRGAKLAKKNIVFIFHVSSFCLQQPEMGMNLLS